MRRITKKIECKQPEYPEFLEGTYTYEYVGDQIEQKFIIAELLFSLGELEEKFEKIQKRKKEKKQKRKEKRNEIHD